MPPLLKFLARRLVTIPATLFLLTAVLYGIIMLAPAETRAGLYMPRGSSNNPSYSPDRMIREIIEQHTPCRRGFCPFRKQHHDLWPYGSEELTQFLAVRVNFLDEETAQQIVGQVIDWKRLPFSERRVLDPQEIVGSVHLCRRFVPRYESADVVVRPDMPEILPAISV